MGIGQCTTCALRGRKRASSDPLKPKFQMVVSWELHLPLTEQQCGLTTKPPFQLLAAKKVLWGILPWRRMAAFSWRPRVRSLAALFTHLPGVLSRVLKCCDPGLSSHIHTTCGRLMSIHILQLGVIGYDFWFISCFHCDLWPEWVLKSAHCCFYDKSINHH